MPLYDGKITNFLQTAKSMKEKDSHSTRLDQVFRIKKTAIR